VVARTASAIEQRAIHVIVVRTGEEALARLKTLILKDADVMSGSSTKLIEIGFEDYVAE